MLRDSLSEFNRLSRQNRLGVTLTFSRQAPAARGSGGADVAVSAASGAVSVTYAGASHRIAIDGSLMHGRTLQFQVNGKIEKAFVFVPSRPLVHTPRGRRAVGVNVMKLIAVHEFVHACGLSNGDHSTDDLFQGSPQVDPGSTSSRDRVRIQAGGRMSWMPPLILSSGTAGHIRRIW